MLCAIYLRIEVNVKIQPQFMLVLFHMLDKNGGMEKICFFNEYGTRLLRCVMPVVAASLTISKSMFGRETN